MKKRRRTRRKIQWPKPYSPVPLDVAKTITRIYLIDKFERKKLGRVRATRGLYHRLSEAFNLPRYTIERLCCKLKDRRKPKVFVRIDIIHERRRLRRRKAKDAHQD